MTNPNEPTGVGIFCPQLLVALPRSPQTFYHCQLKKYETICHAQMAARLGDGRLLGYRHHYRLGAADALLRTQQERYATHHRVDPGRGGRRDPRRPRLQRGLETRQESRTRRRQRIELLNIAPARWQRDTTPKLSAPHTPPFIMREAAL